MSEAKAPRARIVALDLEGTLISNAMSQFPRPGLWGFITFCLERFERTVVYTAVRPARARAVLELLAREGDAPEAFAAVEIVAWSGPVKDLRLIPGVGEARWREAVLVDDLEQYVAPGQASQWVPVEPWVSPYDANDRELERVQRVLASRAGD